MAVLIHNAHREICDVYRENTMSDSIRRSWVRQLNYGHDSVHENNEVDVHPTVFSDELVPAIEEKMKENRAYTINSLAIEFPQISRYLIHEIGTDKSIFENCLHWVRKMLTEQHKKQRLASALDFF